MRTKNKKTFIINMLCRVMLYILIFLIIDYLVAHTLTQYAEATEFPNTIADPENDEDADNSEYGLDNILFEEDMRALEILVYSISTICITFVIIYTFGIPSISSLW